MDCIFFLNCLSLHALHLKDFPWALVIEAYKGRGVTRKVRKVELLSLDKSKLVPKCLKSLSSVPVDDAQWLIGAWGQEGMRVLNDSPKEIFFNFGISSPSLWSIIRQTSRGTKKTRGIFQVPSFRTQTI